MYSVPVFIIIFRTGNPFRIVIVPSLLSFEYLLAFLPIIKLLINPFDVGSFADTPPFAFGIFVWTPFSNSAVPALLRVCALLVIPNALPVRLVGENEAGNDPGDGV